MNSETTFALLQDRLGSLVEWDVLRFFHHNPHTVQGAQQIATALGREVASVNTALLALKDAELIQAGAASAVPVYRLTHDKSLRAEIEQFMRACDNPEFRRRVIEHIVANSAKR